MVFVWIGIGVGVLIAAVLIKKIIKTSPKDPFKIGIYCNKCGYKVNGLKCPRCASTSSQKSWK